MPLVYVAGAWVLGIAAASVMVLPAAVWALWSVVPLGLLALFRRDALLRLVNGCLFVFLLAGLRYTLALPHFDDRSLAFYNDRGGVTLRGTVIAPPQVRDAAANLRFLVTQLCDASECRDVTGTALLQVPRESPVRYGDVLQVTGTPATPSESPDFSYKDYLARQGIHSIIRVYGTVKVIERDRGDPFFTRLYAFRARAAVTLAAIFPEPAAALLTGILLGDDSGIPRDLSNAFSATNTAHIIAISGFNLSLLAGILFKVATRLMSARRAALVVIPGIIAYTLLVGAGPSVVRAAIMAGLSLLALCLGRQNDGLNALAVAALAMTGMEPFTLFDMSFLLSFSATLGLILYADPLTRGCEALVARFAGGMRAKQVVGVLSDSLLVTLAAQLTSTPLIVFAFHRLSLVGLLSNLVVLPVQPAVEIWGGLAVMAGLVFQPAGQVLAWVAWPFLEWTILAVQATARLPFSSIEVGRFDVLWLGLYYAVLLGLTRVNWRAVDLSRLPFRPRPALALGALVVAAIWLWNVAIAAPDGRTHVIFLDTDGAATLVRTPSGRRVLIDGGASPSVLLAALGEQMPFWDRSLDVLVLTRPDEDHLAGLVAALERYAVGMVVQGPAPAKSNATFAKWRDLIAEKNVPSVPAQAGLGIALDREVILEVFQVGQTGTLVPRLRAGTMTFAFAEALTEDEQKSLARSVAEMTSEVLLASPDSPPEFLTRVNPQYVILPTGRSSGDKPIVESVASRSGVTFFRTGERGTIEMITDGRTLAVRTGR